MKNGKIKKTAEQLLQASNKKLKKKKEEGDDSSDHGTNWALTSSYF